MQLVILEKSLTAFFYTGVFKERWRGSGRRRGIFLQKNPSPPPRKKTTPSKIHGSGRWNINLCRRKQELKMDQLRIAVRYAN